MSERLTDEAVLPCPFCGGPARMASERDMDHGGRFYFIKCNTCRAKGAECYASETCPIFFAQVRSAWNRRATPADDLRAENERLHSAMLVFGAYLLEKGEAFRIGEGSELVDAYSAAISQNGGAA